MANPNPPQLPPKPKGPGESYRLSAYLTKAEEQALSAHLEGMTQYQRSRAVARLLMVGLTTTATTES